MPGQSIGELYVDLAARLGGLEKGFAAAKGQAAAAGGQIAASLTGTLTRFLGAAAITAGFAKAVKGAADLNETLSKVGVVFGPAAGRVEALADEMAGRFGLVKGPILDAAASIGLIGKGAGQSAGEAADMADKMARLAADASSFYNVPLEEALGKIRSGLVGESEPLRAFGVLLSENAVKAQALAMGLARGKDQLTEQAKVAARAALIEQGLATASGDLARTAGSTSNQFRQFSGNVENLSNALGAAFLPAVNSALTVLNEGLAGLSGGFNRSQGAVEGWGGTVAGWIDKIGFAFRNLGDLWTIASLQIQEGGENVINAFAVLPENLSRIAHYIATNWRALIVDAINAVITAFRNLQDNLAKLADAIVTWLLDPTQGFQAPDWTPLLTSFQATAEQLPDLLKPTVVSMQSQIDEIFARIGEREAALTRARDAAAAAAAAAGPRGVPGGPAPPPAAEKKTTITGVEDFAKGLLASAFGTAGVAEKQLAAQQRQVTVMELIADTNRIMKDHLAALVSQGGRAVATGPA